MTPGIGKICRHEFCAHQASLQEESTAEQGENFDIREYHNVVLSDGAKPLGVLDAKVERYIRENRTGSE
jgi:uncharacterized protein (DUF885 family)